MRASHQGCSQSRPSLHSARLLDQVRERIRYCHYALRTEQAYVFWIRRFINFHGRRHPRELGGPHVEQFLTHLATTQGVAPSTHKRALAAILFLYREVLDEEFPWMQAIGRPRPRVYVPVVLSREEVASLPESLPAGPARLVASLLYGPGLRLGEALQLRVKDVDFGRRVLALRQAKGFKDRVVMLPARGHRQAGHRARVAALVRGAPAGLGCRHSPRPGTAGPRGRHHDDGLHARPQVFGGAPAEPAGSATARDDLSAGVTGSAGAAGRRMSPTDGAWTRRGQ